MPLLVFVCRKHLRGHSAAVSGCRRRILTVVQFEQNGLPASQSEMPTLNGINPHRRVSQMATSVTSDRSHSPISRTGTPGIHDPNIAPQHVFDGVGMSEHFNGSPSLPALPLTNHSPTGAVSLQDRHTDNPMTYEQLATANTNLRTRVSELEVINMVYSDNETNLRTELDQVIRERDDLKRQVHEMQRRLVEYDDQEHPLKRARLSNEP